MLHGAEVVRSMNAYTLLRLNVDRPHQLLVLLVEGDLWSSTSMVVGGFKELGNS